MITGTLTGTRTLVRLLLRRDRVRLPAWTAGVALFWLYYTRLVPSVYGTEDDLRGAAGLTRGPMGRLFTGPGHGLDELAYDRFLIGAYGLYVLLLVGLMSVLLVVRHTRLEEQTGRAELVRASVVGRHAPLAAALVVAALTNLVVAVAVLLVSATAPELGSGGSVLFAAGVGVTGLAFAGVAAVAAQLTSFSRAAAGLAGGALGASFVVRALGDMASEGGSPLSWLSPLAWPQQTAPFVLDRWWPLALSCLFAAATSLAGFALSARRDLGGSMLAVRPGPAAAPGWLGSPLTLALRLQRAGIVGWGLALVTSGLVFGAWADAMQRSLDDLPEAIVDISGGRDDVVAGYLGLMALFMALVVGIYAVLALQSLRSEETSGRGEPVLATPVSRSAWLGSHLAVASAGVVVLLALTGLATGVAAAAVTGEARHVWDVTVAHLAYVPAVLLVAALATLLFGVAPGLLGATWALLGYGLVVGLFGPLMDLPGWAAGLSPFEHVGRVPLDALRAAPLAALTLLAATTAAAGVAAFRQRDLDLS